MNKPKIGLLLLSAEWLNRIGSGKGFYRDLPGRVAKDGEVVVRALSRGLEIVNPGIIDAPEKAIEAAAAFRKEKVDLVLVCYLTWGEDYLFLDVIKKLPQVPVLLWCYVPYSRLLQRFDMAELFPLSGPVAAVQASGPLKRLNRDFGFVFGSVENKDAINRIFDYSRAARVASELKTARIGLLPSFCNQMSGTHIDKPRLKKEIGPEVVTISVAEYVNLVAKVSDKRVKDFVRGLKKRYRIDRVSDAALLKAGRASLGLADLVDNYSLDALALQDLDEKLHRTIGLRPCLAVPSLFDKAVVSMEGDTGAALAMLVLKRLTGKPVMYTEIFTFDEKKNTVLAGHAGIMDPCLAKSQKEVRIVPDYEYFEVERETAAMFFRAKGGWVTLLSIFEGTERFKMVISIGNAIGGKKILEGSPHIYVKLKTPLPEFFTAVVRTGMTQHWAVVHEDVVGKLRFLAEILKMDCLVIE